MRVLVSAFLAVVASCSSGGERRAAEQLVERSPWSDTLPERSPSAEGGRDIFEALAGLSLEDRELRIESEIEDGNVPDVLRRGFRVELEGRSANRTSHVLEFVVLPDYLAIGSNDDFVRVPLTPMTASRIAEGHGFVLPTPKLVDAIHAAAGLKLEPQPLVENREAAPTFVLHDDLVRKQLGGRGGWFLVSGVKKDVVVTPSSIEQPGRVAIYGWHRPEGRPIQPLYLGHSATYVDYSHGVLLVRSRARLDGDEVDLRDVLADESLSWIVSEEGPMRGSNDRSE
ncbi:MAG: hypothetical protein AAGA20_07400 [Planctomycetota bacterium]